MTTLNTVNKSSYLPEIELKFKTGDIEKVKVTCSNDIVGLLRKVYDGDTLELFESMFCIYLNRNNKTIGWFKVSQGGLSGTVIDVRLILGTALKCGASGIIISHNHPSGNTCPSEADKQITYKLKEGCKILDIALIDHIIITADSSYSFADEGLI